jgi:predicted ATP-grasp superfamily ATP-dependent carboligase
MKILAAGINIRHIACSAARAGHSVIAADCYCDLDLKSCSLETVLLGKESTLADLDSCIGQFSPEAVVLGPGLEEARVEGVNVLNNPQEIASRVSDKLWLSRWLENRGYPTIPTRDSARGVTYPAVVKPRKGAGGSGCRLVLVEKDLCLEEGMIVQDMIVGRPASVSVIGTGGKATAISVNEQLIGEGWTGAEGFRYCGNITPLEPDCPGLAQIAEELVADLGLWGSNGVDFLVTEVGPVVLEVNPRFQGSLDAVELSTGLNVFNAHLQAFDGLLPKRPRPLTVAGRAIIYAVRDLIVTEDLINEDRTDIPRPGSRIGKGDPILSVLATGESRNDVINKLKEKTSGLCDRLCNRSEIDSQASPR